MNTNALTNQLFVVAVLCRREGHTIGSQGSLLTTVLGPFDELTANAEANVARAIAEVEVDVRVLPLRGMHELDRVQRKRLKLWNRAQVQAQRNKKWNERHVTDEEYDPDDDAGIEAGARETDVRRLFDALLDKEFAKSQKGKLAKKVTKRTKR